MDFHWESTSASDVSSSKTAKTICHKTVVFNDNSHIITKTSTFGVFSATLFRLVENYSRRQNLHFYYFLVTFIDNTGRQIKF